jgi:hypothetical protein
MGWELAGPEKDECIQNYAVKTFWIAVT